MYERLYPPPDGIQAEQPNWSVPACIEMWQDFNWECDPDTTIPFASQQEINTYMEGVSGDLLTKTEAAVDHFTDHEGYIVSKSVTEDEYNDCHHIFLTNLRHNKPAIIPFFGGERSVFLVELYWMETLFDKIVYKTITVHDPVDYVSLEITYESLRDDYFLPIDNRYKFVAGDEVPEWGEAGYLEFLKHNGTYYGGPEVYIPEGSTFLRVGDPIGGETLAKRKTDQIKWESNGLTGQIKLELYKNDSFAGTIATNLPIENGSHDWTVGDYINGSVQTGDDYRIKVSMIDESYDDFSNVDFAIGDVNVTVPNGGENWEQGVIRNITWDSSYFSGNVQLVLTKTIPGTDYLIADNIENTGTYQWQVGMCSHIEEPEAPFGMTLPDDCYKIKVVSVDNPDLKDSSDQVFAVVEPQPVITITSPNGGENWQAGSIGNINWTASGLSENIKITLWQNGLLIGNIATPVDPVPGTYSWLVGQYDGGTAPVGNGYTIKIKEIGTAVADFSDVNFTIKGINITSPNGGESWQTGSSRDITWDAPGVAGSLKITLW
ncbi:MAG: hypothetical protein KAW12_19285, partial [Candidatus Aminicenantes bacterium]|nr:hypothetical protein [Candidatus Aminicenantes bacterium]